MTLTYLAIALQSFDRTVTHLVKVLCSSVARCTLKINTKTIHIRSSVKDKKCYTYIAPTIVTRNS